MQLFSYILIDEVDGTSLASKSRSAGISPEEQPEDEPMTDRWINSFVDGQLVDRSLLIGVGRNTI